MNYRRQNLAWAGLALAFAAAAPSVRAADEGGDRAASTSGEPADRAVNSWQQAKQAVRAVRDKETGRLRAPTDEELEQMLQADRAARKARGLSEDGPATPLVVRQHANGMRSAVLGPEYLVTLKAQRTAEGKLSVAHDKAIHEHATPVQPQRATE